MSSPRAARAGLAVLSWAALPIAGAAIASPSGEEIVREADARQKSGSEYYEGALRVVSSKGKVREKGWRYWRLGHGGESKTVIQFVSPPEVAGVGLLTYAHAGRDDEQWMWTPSIRRERRIAPQEKSVRFLGTDFTYEDLTERVIEDWKYGLEREESIGGATCWVVEAEPREQSTSQYSRTLLWFRQADYALVRMEMFTDGTPRRVLVASEHREVQGIVTAHQIVISDVEKGSRTELTLSGVRYEIPLQPEFFTVRSLQEMHAAPE